MNALWSLILFGTIFILLLGLFSLIGSHICRISMTYLETVVAEQRSIILTVCCVAPLFISLISAGLLFIPVGEMLIGMHCHTSGCDLHAPFVSNVNMKWLPVLASAVLLLTTPVLYEIFKLLRQQKRLSSIWKTLSSPANGYCLIDHSIPIAFTLGLLKPVVYVSNGLLLKLDRADLDVVLQHETGHIRRCDNLVKFVASLSTILFRKKDRAQLIDALQLAQEMCCDNYAAKQQTDRLFVAQALLHVNQCAYGYCGIALCGIKGSKIEVRIKALLEPPLTQLPKPVLFLGLSGLTLIPLMVTGPLHHLIESLL